MSRTTFFCLNRFFILIGVTVCMFLPFIRITVAEEKPFSYHIQQFEQYFVPPTESFSPDQEFSESKEKEFVSVTSIIPVELSWHSVLFFVYLSGVFVLLLIYMISYFRMIRLIKSTPYQEYKGLKLIITNRIISPFSWGNYIIIPQKDYKHNPEILVHETMHILHHHTRDLIYIQFLIIFQWFNPAIWLLKRELYDIHEYQADNETIKTGIDATKYQLLLVEKAVGTRLYSMANGFNHSKLKNRISMMLKEKTNKFATLRILLLLPVMCATMYLFAQKEAIVDPIDPVKEIKDNPELPEAFFMMEFKEYQKVAPKYVYEERSIDSRTNSLWVNMPGELMLNNDFVDLENLTETVVTVVTDKKQKALRKTGKPETQIINFFWDRGTSYDKYKEVINALYQASLQLKKETKTSSDSEDINLLYPIVVNMMGMETLKAWHPQTKDIGDEEIIRGIQISVHLSDKETVVLKNFTGKQLKEALEKAMPKTDGCLAISLKVEKDTKMGYVNDVKRLLREAYTKSSSWGFQLNEEKI